MKKGLFITFEGIDGCGKSTQAELLKERIRRAGLPVESLRDPGGTVVSEKIRNILLSTRHTIDSITELLLYESARAQMVGEKIQPWLQAGIIVIVDRFYDSTTAYQGYGRGLDLEMIRQANRIASKGLVPDATLLIDIDWETGVSRRAGVADRMEQEGRSFFERVRQGYHSIAAAEPERVSVIDGREQRESISDAVWLRVGSRLPNSVD